MSKVPPAEIRCDDSRFAVIVTSSASSTEATSLRWNEVKAVIAFKRDLYSTGLICLGFLGPDGTIEVDEEMHGWSQRVEGLPGLLPVHPRCPTGGNK
jgi:hypothetical protein